MLLFFFDWSPRRVGPFLLQRYTLFFIYKLFVGFLHVFISIFNKIKTLRLFRLSVFFATFAVTEKHKIVMEKMLNQLKKLEHATTQEVKKSMQWKEAFKRLAGYVKGTEKLSPETLDRLALIMGFQNWEGLKNALHGTADGDTNFE